MRRRTATILAALALWAGTAGAGNLGLSSKFSDTTVEGLGIGASYNLTRTRSLPLAVLSSSTAEMEIEVEPQAPTPQEVLPGFEPIPDPSWARTVPGRFRLAPGASRVCEVILDLPENRKLLGRRFQAMFWVHNRATGLLGIGLRFRLRFTVSPDPLEGRRVREMRLKALGLGGGLEPAEVSLERVPLRWAIDPRPRKKAKLQIANGGDRELNLNLACVARDASSSPPPGYEPLPDPGWLRVPASIRLRPRATEKITVEADIPNRPECRGRRYAAWIALREPGDEASFSAARVLISTRE